MPALVRALKSVDLPTLGKPTMPHWRLMGSFYESIGYVVRSVLPTGHIGRSWMRAQGPLWDKQDSKSGRWLDDSVQVMSRKVAIVTLSDALLDKVRSTPGTVLRGKVLCGLCLRIGARTQNFIVATRAGGGQVGSPEAHRGVCRGGVVLSASAISFIRYVTHSTTRNLVGL